MSETELDHLVMRYVELQQQVDVLRGQLADVGQQSHATVAAIRRLTGSQKATAAALGITQGRVSQVLGAHRRGRGR
jgi:hypothetical protein